MMIYTPYMNIGPIFLQLLMLVPIYSIASRVVLAQQTLWPKQKAMLPKPLHRHCKRRFFFFFKYIFSCVFLFLPLPSPAFLLVWVVCFSCVCVCFFSSSSHMESCQVAALLLLSQQEERQLLERNVNAALQRKMEELQRNLLQVISVSVSGTLAP